MTSFSMWQRNMNSVFIRGLWGDARNERRPKVLEDAERLFSESFQPEPLVNYCYGLDNLEFFRRHRQDAVLLNELPIVDWGGVGRADPQSNGSIIYGRSFWRHKLRIIMAALETYDEVAWLDMDAHLRKPVPADFWERMRARASIQMPLVSYRTKWCWWRGKHDRRTIPEGAFIYCRDRSIIERADRMYDDPTWSPHTDQTILAFIMDDMAGKSGRGQFSVDGYKADGHEPYCVTIYREFFPADEEVFLVSRGMPHQRWLKKRGRRGANV